MEDERQINWLSLFIKIIIIFIFAIILIWLVSKIINSSKPSETFKNNINNMEEVAVSYFKEIDLPQEKGKSTKITLEEMIEKKLIVSINENKKSTCDVKKSYSKITRNKKDYKVETTLVCGKEKDTITRKFSFKDCKNCNTRTETKNTTKDNTNKDTNKDTTSTNTSTNTTKTTYYEYVKETTTYSKWAKGNKTGDNIENKYEYYSTATEEYYTLGAVSKNSASASYTIKLDKVPNKDYYFTIVKEVEFLSNNEKEFLSSNNTSISKGTKINKLPDSIKNYSLTEDNFTYKLSPYYRKGSFYIDVTLNDINTTISSYNNVYFVPLKVTVKFMSPKITEEKPSGDYDTITYYRYVEKNTETKWSTETSLEGYTKTGNTKTE